MSARILKVDDGKAILIFLVVLGHLLESVGGWEGGGSRFLLVLLYIFHMPAFVFYAGLTASRRIDLDKIIYYLILLSFFHFIYTFRGYVGGSYNLAYFQPYWILWFLMSLIWWAIFLPLLISTGFPVLASIFLALVGGIFDFIGYGFSASRTLVFMPFFVIGAMHGRDLINISFLKSRFLVILFLVISGVSFFSFADLDKRWLYGSVGFEALGAGIFEGVFNRLLIMLLSFLAVTAFLSLIAGLNGAFASIGSCSLSIFLLHGFLVRHVSGALIFFSDLLGHFGLISSAVILSFIICCIISKSGADALIRRQAARCLGLINGFRIKIFKV